MPIWWSMLACNKAAFVTVAVSVAQVMVAQVKTEQALSSQSRESVMSLVIVKPAWDTIGIEHCKRY